MSVADFEALALSQQPASKPWEPVTDYSFEARREVEGQHPALIRDVLQPTRLLDVGCGPGFLVSVLRGYSVNADGCDKTDQLGHPWFFTCDVAVPHALLFAYDVVTCREVLEHLTLLQIRHAISNLCAWSSRLVYCTTRFSSEHDILKVETSDNLDPTHITIASKDLYRILFTLEGFKQRADLEAAMDWKHLNRVLVYERAV